MLRNFLGKQFWTKRYRKILEIEQKQVFLWNVLEVISYSFLAYFPKFGQLGTFFFWQLGHSIYSDKNLNSVSVVVEGSYA